MRSAIVVLLALLMMPTIYVSADEEPFQLYVEDDMVIHPGETVQFRIAWHNLVGFERHLSIDLDSVDDNVEIEGLPIQGKRVASGRLGDVNLNVTVDPSEPFGTKEFTFSVSCIEVPDWSENYTIEVLVSRWSSLNFGANNGSSFYAQQDGRTTLAMNISNSAGVTDTANLSLISSSDWDYGFSGDDDGDGIIQSILLDGEDKLITFWIEIPPVVDGAPIAGTGPTFTLQAVSNIDRKLSNWTFSIEIQTWHNMTIDVVEQDLSLDPGSNGRLEVEIRNNGNIPTFLVAELNLNGVKSNRIESNGWTIALFNVFEFQSLQPNESRTLDIGFSAPDANVGEISIQFSVNPQGFQERKSVITVGSNITWNRGGELSVQPDLCASVEVNSTCQIPFQINNTGNHWDSFSLRIVDVDGIIANIDEGTWPLAAGAIRENIILSLETIEGAAGLSEGSLTVELVRQDGVVISRINIITFTAPYVEWTWQDSQFGIDSSNRLQVTMTLRNDGNIEDGLIVRMSTSYFTEMSFVPPENATYESETDSIRSFEIFEIPRGENFTFRAWTKVPQDQNDGGVIFLNITAHSRLAEEKPFIYTTNATFEAGIKGDADDGRVIDSIFTSLAAGVSAVWAWKWIMAAALVSGIMINKSLKDRNIRSAEYARLNPEAQAPKVQGDWMADFRANKQEVLSPAISPHISPESFTGMFAASSGDRKPSSEPVASQLVGAASTVLDHHDGMVVKTKLDGLAHDISVGDISRPHRANVALPDDVVPVTSRTVPVKNEVFDVPAMLDLDELDL